VLSQVQVYTALMAAEISLPVEALVASTLRAMYLFSCCFMLEHMTTKVVDTLESFIALVAIESGILCCGFDPARPVQ
jgi:hypothetical protein